MNKWVLILQDAIESAEIAEDHEAAEGLQQELRAAIAFEAKEVSK